MPGTKRTQEAKATDAFTGVTRPEASIDDGMGATLNQIDPLHLRKSTVATVTMMPAKDRHIGRGVGDIFHGAVNRHQAQPKEKGARRRLRRQRLTNLMKQRHQRACTQVDTADSSRRWRRHRHTPDPATHSATLCWLCAWPHPCDRLLYKCMTISIRTVTTMFSLRSRCSSRSSLANTALICSTWQHLLQHFEFQFLAEFALSRYLA